MGKASQHKADLRAYLARERENLERAAQEWKQHGGQYLLGIHFLPLRFGDWMMRTWRWNDEPRRWHIDYRVRYQKDDKLYNSQDEKHWYKAELDIDEDDLLPRLESVAQLAAAGAGKSLFDIATGPLDFLLIQGDPAQRLPALHEAGGLPDWLHFDSGKLTDAGVEPE